jgi:hypothetical protein
VRKCDRGKSKESEEKYTKCEFELVRTERRAGHKRMELTTSNALKPKAHIILETSKAKGKARRWWLLGGAPARCACSVCLGLPPPPPHIFIYITLFCSMYNTIVIFILRTSLVLGVLLLTIDFLTKLTSKFR